MEGGEVILGIDIGNTRAKFALISGGEAVLIRPVATASLARESSPGFPREVESEAGDVDGIIVSCVVPRLSSPVCRAAAMLFEVPVVLVNHRTRLPFEFGVEEPARVGADRLCLAAGAVAAGKKDAIVVDVGSAVTIDLLRKGVFMGGVIGSGPDLVLSALAGYTAGLPRISFTDVENPFDGPCNDTVSAMGAGAALGTLGLIREAAAYLQKRSGSRPSCMITGGYAPGFLPFLPRYWVHDGALIYRGMDLIWSLNAK